MQLWLHLDCFASWWIQNRTEHKFPSTKAPNNSNRFTPLSTTLLMYQVQNKRNDHDMINCKNSTRLWWLKPSIRILHKSRFCACHPWRASSFSWFDLCYAAMHVYKSTTNDVQYSSMKLCKSCNLAQTISILVFSNPRDLASSLRQSLWASKLIRLDTHNIRCFKLRCIALYCSVIISARPRLQGHPRLSRHAALLQWPYTITDAEMNWSHWSHVSTRNDLTRIY